MKRQKHLLFLLDYYPPHRWWVENVFENIITRLLQKGYEISLITSRFDKDLSIEEQQKNFHLYRGWKGRFSFFFFSFFKGIEILKKHPDIEVIHASTYTSVIPASLLGKFFNKKKILTVHEMFGKLWNQFKPRYSALFYQWLEKILFLFSFDYYHCVSLYTLNTLRTLFGVEDSKLRLIYNGVDTDFRNPQEIKELTSLQWREKYGWEDRFLMLYYGHSGKSKGIDYLIQALPKVLSTSPDSVFVFNLIPCKRDQEIKQKILKIAKKIWCSDRVFIFSWREKEQLRELVSCANVVFAPSLAEGFGSVHSEVCAMGIPLITRRVAAIPEVVSGKVIFLEDDTPQGFLDAIEKVKNGDFEEGEKKCFSREKTVEKIENLYE